MRPGKFGWLDAFTESAPEDREAYNILWRVAVKLFQSADVDALTTRPGRDRIARELGVTPKTVTRQINKLIELGWIVLHERSKSGGRNKGKGMASVYLLTIPERINGGTSLEVSPNSEINGGTSTGNGETSTGNGGTSTGNGGTSHGVSPLKGPVKCPQESLTVTTLPPSADNSPSVSRDQDAGQGDTSAEASDVPEQDAFDFKDQEHAPTSRRCDNCGGPHAATDATCPAKHGQCANCHTPLTKGNTNGLCGPCREEANAAFTALFEAA